MRPGQTADQSGVSETDRAEVVGMCMCARVLAYLGDGE